LLEDSKSDVRAEKFGEIDAYRLELLARKKGGQAVDRNSGDRIYSRSYHRLWIGLP
ncbi:unnamed protein product, partial [marine sediment metagenome]